MQLSLRVCMQVQQLWESAICRPAAVSQWVNHLVGRLCADSCPQPPVPAASRLECRGHGSDAVVSEA